MASARYTLNIKPEDLIPDEPLPQTRQQKIQNWLHYHKWWLIGGAALLVVLGIIVRDVVTAPKYDYTVGIVTARMLPDQILDELSEAFATLADDRDGNGEVAVQVRQYNLQFTEESEDLSGSAAAGEETASGVEAAGNMTNAYEQIAAMTRLTGDLSGATSFIYLTDDPAGLQNNALLFCYLDGTTPAEDAADVENMTVAWADTPAAQLELEPLTLADGSQLDVQEWMSRYYFGFVADADSRTYQKEDVQAYRADSGRLWEALTGLPSPAGAAQ